MNTRRLLAATCLVALFAVACGSDPVGSDPTSEPATDAPAAPSGGPAAGAPIPGGGLTVADALASDLDGILVVGGALVAVDGQPARLCDALAESYPPQCAGPSLEVQGVDLAGLDGLQSAEGTTWGRVSLAGRVVDGVLTVDPTVAS